MLAVLGIYALLLVATPGGPLWAVAVVAGSGAAILGFALSLYPETVRIRVSANGFSGRLSFVEWAKNRFRSTFEWDQVQRVAYVIREDNPVLVNLWISTGHEVLLNFEKERIKNGPTMAKRYVAECERRSIPSSSEFQDLEALRREFKAAWNRFLGRAP